jgi:hypothetical protein
MECRFLGFHVLNQFADAFGQKWIAHPRGKLSVVFDLLVEFFAFVTHRGSAFSPNSGYYRPI